MTGRLEGKVALVTGAAQGIGAACVALFAAEGAQAIATDIQGGPVENDPAALRLVHDVADEQAWVAVMEQVEARFGRLDVLVNNAGIVLHQPIEDSSLDDWNRMLAVNLTGTMLGCKHALRLMKRNPGGPSGSIINLSSIAGYIGLPEAPAYTAAKGGVRQLTKSVAVYAAQRYRTIRCNSLHPGLIDTPIHGKRLASVPDPEATRARMAEIQPMGRVGEPAEIAAAALFLASDDARFVTGTELLVDGGWLAEGGLRAIR